MTTDLLMQTLRILLQSAGLWLAAHGIIKGDPSSQATFVTAGAGALMWAGSIAWGFYVKWNTKAVPAATGARADVPTVSPVTGAVQR